MKRANLAYYQSTTYEHLVQQQRLLTALQFRVIQVQVVTCSSWINLSSIWLYEHFHSLVHHVYQSGRGRFRCVRDGITRLKRRQKVYLVPKSGTMCTISNRFFIFRSFRAEKGEKVARHNQHEFRKKKKKGYFVCSVHLYRVTI